MKKLCTKCGTYKHIKDFCKDNKSKDKLFYWCKSCAYEQKVRASRTKKGLIKNIYYSQRSSSVKRKHRMPKYTKNELITWTTQQTSFSRLYDNWVKSKYNKWLKPSIDRIDDNKGYTLSNIQIMTWRENKDKEHRDLKSGKLLSRHTPIVQYDLKGNKIAEFVSQQEAGRQLNIKQSYISRVCTGSRTHTKGFVFKFL